MDEIAPSILRVSRQHVTRWTPLGLFPAIDNGRVTVERRLDPETQGHVSRALDALFDEFGDSHPRDTIEGVMDNSLTQLVGDAEVTDFLATLAYRFSRERLKATSRGHGTPDAASEVLFVGLGDSGRGQIASALVTLRSEGRVVTH